MKYPIAGLFLSLKGEGLYTGVPMSFIRLAGCNLNCEFCDTDFSKKTELTTEQIVTHCLKNKTKYVVITGGEPLIHDLDPLLQQLHHNLFLVHLETNGTLPLPVTGFDWIAVSPKEDYIDPSILPRVNEIKFLVGLPGWEDHIKHLMEEYPIALHNTNKIVMPIADPPDHINQINTRLAMNYCMEHPDFRFCCQLHKYLKIP